MNFNDEIVETSDAEELEEIERKELKSRKQRAMGTPERLTPPPRKKAKYFHATDSDEEPSGVSHTREDSPRMNSPRRSQSSSTMFTTNTSPGPLFTSRSPTQSPGQAYSIQSLPKTEDEDVLIEFDSPPPDGSQDSLLLHSPTQPIARISSPLASLRPSNISPLAITQPTSTTPLHSPPRNKYDFSSPPLQFPDSPLPIASQEISTEGENMVSDLLLFTPTKKSSQPSRLFSRSPSVKSSWGSRNVSREPEHSPALSQASENDGRLLRSVTPVPSVPLPQEDASIALANELNEELNEGGRYSFRKRTVTQKMPFTTEDLRYKRQLKAIPEAIVKNKALERQHHHHHHHPQDRYEEDGETQQDSFVDDGINPEDDAWERMEGPRKRRRIEGQQDESVEPNVTRYPGILQGLPDTDEEEDKEMDAVTREARRLIKRKAKEQKAKEKQEREQKAREESLKAKRFPVSKRLQLSPKRKSLVETADTRNDEDNKDEESSRPGSQAPTRTPGAHQPSNTPSTPVSAAMREYFAQNDDFYIDNHENQCNHEIQDDHFVWDRNSPVNDYDPAPLSPIKADSYETPLPVNVDGDISLDNDNGNGPDQSQPTKTDPEIKLDLEPKKARALRKMYPEFMIRGMVNGAGGSKTSKPQRAHEKAKDSEDEGLPQAGHTRKQISAHPKDIKDIKGDSESELEPSNSDSDSSTDSSSEDDDDDRRYSAPSSSGAQHTPGHQRRIVKTEKREIIDLTSFQSDEDENWPSTRLYQRQRKGNSVPRLRDSSMIDYMLAKSSRLEPKRSKRTISLASSGGKQQKFKHDIMTGQGRKYGRETQTTLDFHSNGASTSHHSRKSEKRKSSSRHAPDDVSDEDDEHQGHDARSSDLPLDSFQQRKLDRKRKYKEKKRREKHIGVHVFSGGAQKIVSGRRQLRLNVSNTEIEEFQKVFLPSSQAGSNQIDWSRAYAPPLVEKRLKRRATPDNTSNDHVSDDELTTKVHPTISSHFNIPILQPGKSFGPKTNIKKEWLYQLTTPDPDAAQPFIIASTILEFEIAPDMRVDQLCALLPSVFEGLLEYVTGLPDPDSEFTKTQWLLLMRGLSQLTSWQLKSSGIEEASNLRNTVQREVLQLVEQIEQTSMNFIDWPTLTVCWFMVDMSARIRYHSLPPSTQDILDKPLKYSSSLLMRVLLKFGIDKTMQVLLDDTDLDGTTPARYSLELWVSLIHVLGIVMNAEVRPQKHPFWQLLKDALALRVTELSTRTPLESSEDVWFTVLSVCTMSQFSVHGMTLSHFHLPADWSIISFAFGRMHLGKVPQRNEHAKLFDRYVSLLVDRCYDLHERYKWNLDDPNTFGTFNELAVIFRARKFANLLHEKSEYSRFFQKADWDLLPSRARKDSAFTVFLKLVVQAALGDKLHAAGKPSPRVKKLLSIVIPMGSLPFTEDNKPQGNDLTKFYNRITALVVAGDLDRTSIDERIQKARGYINFATADRMSRIAVIRAIRNWGIMLVDRKMSLKAFSPWIEELANVLVAEIKQLPGLKPGKHDDKQRLTKPLIEMISCLLWSVRNISSACAKHARYPYIYFLESLRPLLVQGTFDFQYPRIAEEYLLLLESFFTARSAALPPPPRPSLAALPSADEESQESQDFGIEDDFANMDWSGLDLPDLAPLAPPKSRGDDDDDSSFLASMKNLTSIRWVVFRALKPYLSRSKGCEIAALEHCKGWLHSWFGFASVDDQWILFLSKVDEELHNCREEHWVRNVELCIMLNVLKYSPMQYLVYGERAFGSLLNALVSANNIVSDTETHNMFEREYVSWVFSIDGLRHSLLSNMAVDLPARNEISGDYEFGPDEFLALRIPLLRAIFKNLEKQITLQLRGASGPEVLVSIDTDRYITLCNNMFSGVRNNLLRLEKPSAKFTEYLDFSKEAVDALQGNRELCQRMKFWADWRP